MCTPRDPAAKLRRTFIRALLTGAAVWGVSLNLSAAAQGTAGATARIDDEVRRASDEWFEALRRTDLVAIDRLEAEDFLTIQEAPTGVAVIEKKAQLAGLKAAKGASPRLHRELSNVRIRVYGDTAILSAVAVFQQEATGAAQPAGSRSVITEVWIKQNNRWRIAHFATHPVRDKGRR